MKNIVSNKYLESFDAAWLDLTPSDIHEIFNPFINMSPEDAAQPDKHVVRMMRSPKYIGFAAKYLLNIELLPIQIAILQELWVRPFPMLIASRGFGKALGPQTPVRVKNGWRPIKDIEVGDKVYGSDGKLANVTGTTILQTNLNFYKITLRDGRTIECCEDHMWKVWDKNKNRNKTQSIYSELTTKQLLEHYYWERIDSKSKERHLTKEYRYALPINKPLIEESTTVVPIHPYVVGVLLGDGCVTQKTITFTTADPEIAERVNKYLPRGYVATKQKSNQYTYGIKRLNKSLKPFYTLCQEIGIWGHNASTKFIPQCYQYGSYEQKLELVRGLMDTDGYSSKSVIEFYTISNQLSDDFLNVARSLGLHCKHSTKKSWLSGQQYADCNRISIYTKEPIFTLPRKPAYVDHNISKQGASKYDKVFITNIEYVGKGDGYCISVDNADKTYITKDYIVTHNSFLLAVFSMLKCALVPDSKVVVCGAGLRQSKVIFEYMESIWYNAPVLRSIFNTNKDGPARDIDRCIVRLHNSWAIFLPIGDGSKIRGLRAHTIIADEFACLDENTIVETNHGLMRIKDTFIDGIQLINKNGDMESPSSFIKTPPTDVYEIKTSRGYGFKCSNIHQVETQNGWKLAKNLIDSDYLVFKNLYTFPSPDNDIIDIKDAWLLGLAVAEGTCTKHNSLSIKTTDIDIVKKIKTEYSSYLPKIYKRKAYVDARGWNCKPSYEIVFKKDLRDKFYKFGLNYVTSHHKCIPFAILQSSRGVVLSFLSGLFDGDGSAFVWESRGKKSLGVSYYSVSEQLVNEVHILLSKLDIIGNKVLRSSKLSNHSQWMLRYNGEYAHQLFDMLDIPRWKHINLNELDLNKKEKKYGVTFAKNMKKWKCAPYYAGRLVVVGYYDTEEEAIAASKEFWKLNPPLLKVSSVNKLEKQQNLYDYELPITNSFFGNGFIQHNSINPQIYETVIGGFAAVSKDPVQNVKDAAKRAKMKEAGVWTQEDEIRYESSRRGNQSIITGTADYAFKHFAEYHRRYCNIINSKGDPKKLAELFGDDVDEAFRDWKAYSVVRIPYELIPKGFMDDRVVARSKATMHMGIYQMEYGTVFTEDSDGFFKRSLLESCVATDSKPIQLPSGPVWFDPMTRGLMDKQYVIGVDPASERDNFSIVVIELRSDHNRIVYAWSTNKKNFKERQDAGLTGEHDYYAFCARKIREIMKAFPTVRIAIDTQGGGVAILEALHDPDKTYDGEQLLWPIKEEGKEKDTDHKQGLHIIEMINFASADWTAAANHGMRKDFEDKVLLFPRFDNITIGLAIEQDAANARAAGKSAIYDSMEDCVWEIEELKNELSTIVMTKTANSNRDRWDTPEIKEANGKKGRLRKDRYSSLLMANMVARTISRTDEPQPFNAVGGAVMNFAVKQGQDLQNQPLYGHHAFWTPVGIGFGISR